MSDFGTRFLTRRFKLVRTTTTHPAILLTFYGKSAVSSAQGSIGPRAPLFPARTSTAGSTRRPCHSRDSAWRWGGDKSIARGTWASLVLVGSFHSFRHRRWPPEEGIHPTMPSSDASAAVPWSPFLPANRYPHYRRCSSTSSLSVPQVITHRLQI